jgi:hypothetical protein
VVGTMGGAAIAIGVAGAGALQAQNKADELGVARGAAVSDSGTLVTKAAVTAAEAEAEQKKLEFGVAVVTNLLVAGVEAAASHLNPGELEKALPTKTGSAEGESSTEIDKLRDKLNAQSSGQGDPAASTDPAAATTTASKTGQAMKSWGTTTIPERSQAVADVVNVRLGSDGVPAIETVPHTGEGGNFSSEFWTARIDETLLKANEISEEDFNTLVDTAYHEARHARQYWQMARMKAADGSYTTAAEMARELHIKEEIAEAAWDKKMTSSDPLYAETQELFESFYGTGRLNRDRIVSKINAYNSARGVLEQKTAALEEVRARIPPAGGGQPAPGATDLFDLRKAEMEVSMAEEANDQARAEALNVWDDYQQLPEEVQARTAGQEKSAWASRGLAARARVRAADAKLDAARARLDAARAKLNTAAKGSPAYIAAEQDWAQAEADVDSAQTDIATARDYSALDTWNQAPTK